MLALGVGALSVFKKGNRILMVVVGAMLTWIGGDALISGRIYQRHHGGPPIEGPLATIGAILILAVGVYCVYQAVTTQEENPKKK